MTTSMVSVDVEMSSEKLDALVKASESADGGELAGLATEVPRLVIEVSRLRQERDERVRELGQAKRKIQDQAAYIETLQPRAHAEHQLRETQDRVAVLVTERDKVTRERDEGKRTIESLEDRVKTLLAAMFEMARGTSAEKYAQEAQEQRARAERAERELAELKLERAE